MSATGRNEKREEGGVSYSSAVLTAAPGPDQPPSPSPAPGAPRARIAAVVAVAVLIVVLAAAVGMAMGGSTTPTQQANAKARDYAAGKPKAHAPFTATDAGFSMDFPAAPKRQEQQVPAGATSLRLVQYTSELSSDVGFSAGWFRLPQPPAPDGVKTFLDATVNGSVAAIKGKLLGSQSLTVGTDPAVEYTASATQGHFVKARTILVGSDVYILQVVSDRQDPVGYGRFVSSFRLTSPRR
ncbi:MAG TPA: hypothetical protein VFA94_08840 [Acidimicrobiales bacterium]|nr:hypothetical protein [Acidimicrobiales bacterium]